MRVRLTPKLPTGVPPRCVACFKSLCLFGGPAAVVAAAASTCEPLVFALALCLALVVFFTSWRSLLPRKVFEDPSTVQINRLPTHSRLSNYPTFEEAAARGERSPNIVSLRYDLCVAMHHRVNAAACGVGNRYNMYVQRC